jgi:arsenate reductase
MNKPIILFLCTENSCRSQMAEALLRHRAGGRFTACSAGLEPKPVHPLALRVLGEIGVETAELRPKPVRDFLGKQSIKHAVVVCEKAQRNCPRVFPFAQNNMYWPFEDPAVVDGGEEAQLAKFRAVRDEIDEKIQEWLELAGDA